MHVSAIADGFEVTVVLSGATSIAMLSWMAWRARARTPASISGYARALMHPFVQFLGVCAALFANQVLFNAYVLAAHQGDPSFVARYLPRGWFAVTPDAPLVRFAARHLPAAWMAPSVLN